MGGGDSLVWRAEGHVRVGNLGDQVIVKSAVCEVWAEVFETEEARLGWHKNTTGDAAFALS